MKIVPLRISPLLLASLLLVSAALSAQPPAPAKASVASLAFLTGHWTGTASFGGTVECHWMAPSGDNVMGAIRMMNNGKATMYEILVAEQVGDGVVLRVKHFNPGLTGREEKDASDQYHVVELGKERVLLEKIGGDPLRVVWEIRPGNTLVAARGTKKDGQWAFSDLFTFKSGR